MCRMYRLLHSITSQKWTAFSLQWMYWTEIYIFCEDHCRGTFRTCSYLLEVNFPSRFYRCRGEQEGG
jgi:hypothetical protein